MLNSMLDNVLNVSVKKVASHRKEVNHFVSKWVKSLLRAAFLLGMGFVMLYPVLYMISGAFKSKIDVYDPTVIWIPKNYSLQSVKLAMTTLDYWVSLLKTLQILVPSVLFQLISTLLAAYGFAKFKFKERNILFGLLIFTIIVPIQTIIIPVYVNFKYFDFFGIGKLIGLFTGEPLTVKLLNTTTPFYLMAISGMGIRSGLYIFIMRQFFRNMPKELEEAAMIDGCGPFKTFTRIMIPNVIPAIVTILLFSIVWYWNDFYQSVMFLQNGYPLSVSLTMMNGLLDITGKNISSLSHQDLWLLRDSVLVSGCLLVVAPILILYIFLQRFFTESIERTGIVG